MKVFFIAGRRLSYIEGFRSLQELRKLAEVKMIEETEQEKIKRDVEDVDVIIVAATYPISAEVINSAEELRLIQTTSVGFNHVDLKTAITNGVVVCNAAESNANSVAELCFGLMLDLARRISAHNRLMSEGGWARVEMERQIQLRHKTLGIIGLGAIESRMAQIGSCGFGMTVLACDPYITEERVDRFSAKLVDLTTIMKESDVITVHVPLNEDTRHMIGEREFDYMKSTAILINASRGPVIDEQALIRTLEEKRISGAGLDVFEKEPLPEDTPLRRVGNAVITPHIGSSSEGLRSQYDVAIKNVVRFAEGEGTDAYPDA